MTLTLNLPSEAARADANYQAKLRRAADALRDADLITPEQAAQLAGPTEAAQNTLHRPSEAEMAEWRAKLHQIGQYSRRTEPLSIEATSREYIYGDDLP